MRMPPPTAKGRKMARSTRKWSLLPPGVFVALTLAAAPSLAVVGGIDNPGEFSDPANQYYGMNWSYNYATAGGTGVAIGYFTLITAAHYSLPVGTTFTANGDTFRIMSMEPLLPDPNQGTKTPDLRVLHVKNETNQYRPLPGFYDLYEGSFSNTGLVSTSSSFVVVGTGDTGSVAIAFFYTDTASTRALRWGTNMYDRLYSNPQNSSDHEYPFTNFTGAHATYSFIMDYNKAQYNPTTHESGVGAGDSGGGVFIKDGNTNTWKLAGISLYRDVYSDFTDRYINSYAASIPHYAPQLYNVLQYDLLPGDLNLDGNVDSSDFITLKANFGKTGATWSQGDFNGDGVVGYEDLLAIQTNFGYRSSPHPIMTPPSVSFMSSVGAVAAPEPTTLLLMAAGAVGLTARRRRRLTGGR